MYIQQIMLVLSENIKLNAKLSSFTNFIARFWNFVEF